MQKRKIKGYEGLYEITSDGRVWSCVSKKYLKLNKTKYGYYLARLSKNNKVKAFTIHRLVALHFIDNPYNKETVNHIDGNKSNNKQVWLHV